MSDFNLFRINKMRDRIKELEAELSRRTPAPKVDMGPQKDKKIRQALDWLSSGYEDKRGLERICAEVVLRLTEALSSTPPDPSSAAKEAVIPTSLEYRAAYSIVARMNERTYTPEASKRKSVAEKAWRAAVDRLGALDQEKPCQCGNPILRWVHQQPPKECGKP